MCRLYDQKRAAHQRYTHSTRLSHAYLKPLMSHRVIVSQKTCIPGHQYTRLQYLYAHPHLGATVVIQAPQYILFAEP